MRLWSLEAEKCMTSLIGHEGEVKISEYHPFGNFFATAGESKIKIWDARSRKAVQEYRGEDVKDLKFSPHGRWLACVGSFGTKIFDLGKAAVVWERREEISKCLFHPVDFFFLTCERNTKIWNCVNDSFGQLAFSDPHNFPSAVNNAAFSGDGGLLFQTSAGGDLRCARLAGDGSLATAGILNDAPWKAGRVLDIVPDGNNGDCLVLAADSSDGLFAPNLSVHRVMMTATKPERKKRDVPIEILTTSASVGLLPEASKPINREILKLTSQLTLLRRVMNLWSKGSTLQAASEAAQDPTLFGIFLFALPLERQNVPLSLDLCRQLLVLMPRALAETKSENFASACVYAGNVLLARFGDFIRDMRDSETSAGVDLQRELRAEKCKECFEGFRKIFNLLCRLQVAEKENLDTLKAFLGN